MDFIRRTPFFRLLLPVMIGIVAFQYIELAKWVLYVFFGLSFVFVITSLLLLKAVFQYKFRWLFGCGIFLFLMSFAYFLSSQKEKDSFFSDLENKGVFRVELTDAPVEKAKTYCFRVKVLGFFENGQWRNSCGNAVVYVQKDSLSSKLLFGDRLMIETEFKKPMGTVNPDGFDYAAYLKRQGISATCYLNADSWQKTDFNQSFSIRRFADKNRNSLLQIYRDFKIEGDEFAVLAALTLGYTDALQPDLRTSYSATGAMHILSVSGLHVGIIYVVIAFLLGFLNKNHGQRILKAILILLFLWFYAFITGLSPSVVRSALMFSFVSVGVALERKSQIYNTIFMSAFLMLLVNPDFLFDVGFQLSYAAVLSIVLFQKPISNLFPTRNKAFGWTRDLFAVSIAAQLGTAPFTLYYFHQFPNYFLLTNLVAIPLSTVVIQLSIVLLAVHFIPYLSVLVAFFLKWSLWLLNFLIVGIHNLPFSVSVVSFDAKQMVLVMLVIFFVTAYFYTKKFTPLFFCLLAILTVSVLTLQMKFETLNTKKMIVYSGQKETHVNIIDGAKNYVFSTDTAKIDRIAGSYWRLHRLDCPTFIKETNWHVNGYAFFGGKRILILNEKLLRNKTFSKPLFVDFLIVGKGLKPNIEQLFENINPRKIVVDNSISEWYTQSIRQACESRNISFYSVAEQGAYMLNFTN